MNHNQQNFCSVQVYDGTIGETHCFIGIQDLFMYSHTFVQYHCGGVVEMLRLILQLFNCWLSLPCNNKVANKETDDRGDDEGASIDVDGVIIGWYDASEDGVLNLLNDKELVLIVIVSKN